VVGIAARMVDVELNFRNEAEVEGGHKVVAAVDTVAERSSDGSFVQIGEPDRAAAVTDEHGLDHAATAADIPAAADEALDKPAGSVDTVDAVAHCTHTDDVAQPRDGHHVLPDVHGHC